MKVLNLRCANGHGFEGWFASDDDYMDQNGRGLVECPLCADRVIARMPSAPRLNLSGAREPAAAPAPAAAADELLELHQGEVGLDAGGVAVHHEADGAGGRQDGGLRVAPAVGLAEPSLLDVVPGLGGRGVCSGGVGAVPRVWISSLAAGVLEHDALVGRRRCAA